MFYQIPEILLCHEFFLQQLQARVNEWHDKQKIGDIFVSSVRLCEDKPTTTVLSKVTTFYFNTSDTPSCHFMCCFFVLPHFDILLNRRTATWNLFVKWVLLWWNTYITFSFLFLVYQVFSGRCLQCIHKSLSASQSCCKGGHSNQACFCAVHGGTNNKIGFQLPYHSTTFLFLYNSWSPMGDESY